MHGHRLVATRQGAKLQEIDLHQLANRSRPPFRRIRGSCVVGDHPWFQITRGVEKVYITDLLVVKMINPLFDQLSLGGDIVHSFRLASHFAQ